MTKNKLRLCILLLLAALGANAQGDLTLYSLRSLHQSTYLNPAFMPEYDLSVGVPLLSNIGVGAQLGGFDLNTVSDNIGDDHYLDLTGFSKSINASLFGVNVFQQCDLFHVRQQFGHYQVSLHSGTRVSSHVALSRDFIGFILQGNGNYAGQNVSLEGNSVQLSSYIETGLGVAREFERFTVGARVKMLNGIVNVSSKDVNIQYYTGTNSYDPTVIKLAGSLNTSGLPFMQDSLNGEKNNDTSFSSSNISPFRNTGFAIDLGITYRITPRLNLLLSAIDLGSITWKNKTYNYKLNDADITYVGLNYAQIKDADERQRYTDSLRNLVKGHTSNESYSTPLVSRLIAGLDYDLSLRDRAGFMFQLQHYAAKWLPSYTLSYTRKVGTNWDITANYSYYNSSFANLGLGTVVKMGAFQFYIMQDDILVYLLPGSARTVYLRLGCNLVWGAQRPRPRY